IAVCASCAQALEEAGQVDETLEALFAEVRPDPALEDRMIHALRAVPVWRSSPMFTWVAGGAAGAVLLGVLGAGVSHLVAQGAVPFPGMPGAWAARMQATNNLKQIGLAELNTSNQYQYQSQFATKPDDLQDANQLAEERRSNLAPVSVRGLLDYDGYVGGERQVLNEETARKSVWKETPA